MVNPLGPPIQTALDAPFTTSACTATWKPKMKYKYSLNAFCGCSDYIIGEEPYGFDDFALDSLPYMRSSLYKTPNYIKGMLDKFEDYENPNEFGYIYEGVGNEI